MRNKNIMCSTDCKFCACTEGSSGGCGGKQL